METAIQKVEERLTSEINLLQGASMLKIAEEEQKKLTASFDENEIEIRPDGLIYLPQTFWRQRLNQSFGLGQWCLIIKGSHKDPDPKKDKLYVQGVLMVRGCYVAEAVGEAELHSNNPMQSWASVFESAKSDCITRCCKDLSIASELWQPEFTRRWVKEYAVQVWREKTGKKKDGSPGSFQWRKKTADKFYDERGGTAPAENKTTPENKPAAKAQTNGNGNKLFDEAQPTTAGGKITPNQGAELPWLNDKQFDRIKNMINEGDTEAFEKTKAAFRLKKDHREQLQQAHDFTVNLKKESGAPAAPVKIEVSNEIALQVETCEDIVKLEEIWNENRGLHSIRGFGDMINKRKVAILKTTKSKSK